MGAVSIVREGDAMAKIPFPFYPFPKFLLSDYELSAEAMLLYMLMVERFQSSKSKQGKWRDANGRVFIYFKTEEIMQTFHVNTGKASKMLNELEATKLISRKRQGQGKPVMIFVNSVWNETCENRKSRPAEIAIHSLSI